MQSAQAKPAFQTIELQKPYKQGEQQATPLEPFVKAETAGEFLHYSPRTVKQMAREGRIPAHPFGGGARKRWYFLISELAEHLHTQVNSAHGEAGRDETQRRVH
jgi:hypothetical protein